MRLSELVVVPKNPKGSWTRSVNMAHPDGPYISVRGSVIYFSHAALKHLDLRRFEGVKFALADGRIFVHRAPHGEKDTFNITVKPCGGASTTCVSIAETGIAGYFNVGPPVDVEGIDLFELTRAR